MQTRRFLKLPELLRVMRAARGWSLVTMAARCGVDPLTYRRLELGQAPSRALFDALVEGLPVLGAVLLQRSTEADPDWRARIALLQALAPEAQVVELARIHLELQWRDGLDGVA